MIRAVILAICAVHLLSPKNDTQHRGISSITIADSIHVQLYILNDSSALPNLYYANVNTPVCEVDKCYFIELKLYWDLIGRFHHFDTIPGKELTKLDHKPFIDRDYIKLNEILANPNSPLANYSKEELVKSTRTSEIDGFTGATIQEIKASVIGGAVYSCHTLWHIAYGAVSDSIHKNTSALFSSELVKSMVSQGDPKVNYYLINSFSDLDFEKYLGDILSTMESDEGYYAKNLIERIPERLINKESTQLFIAGKYNDLNYFAKVALLQKLDRDSLMQPLKEILINDLGTRKSRKSDLIRQLTHRSE